MGNDAGKTGLRKVQASLSERMSSMEQGLIKLVVDINQKLTGINNQFTGLQEYVDALTQLQGAADVNAFVQNARVEKLRANAETEKAALLQGISDGYVLTADTVGERSLVIGRFYDKDGKIEEPGRNQLAIPGVFPTFRSQLIGQKAGFTLDIPTGKFELQEIYNIDEEKAKALQEAKQAEAVAQAAAAAAATAAKDETQDTAAPTAPAAAPATDSATPATAAAATDTTAPTAPAAAPAVDPTPATAPDAAAAPAASATTTQGNP